MAADMAPTLAPLGELAGLFEGILGQDRALGQLASSLTSGRLTHALACVGPNGVGKALTAKRLAAWLLAGGPGTSTEDWQAEQRLMQAQAHPDFLTLVPDDSMAKPEIKVESARRLVSFMQQTPSRARWRVALVEQAEKLNRQAANGILKILEEPPASATIILLVSDLEQVLPTIRSRVTALPFAPLTPEAMTAIAQSQALSLSPEAMAASGGSLETARSLSDAKARDALAQIQALLVGRLDPAQEAALLTWCLANPELAFSQVMRQLNAKGRSSGQAGLADAYFAIADLEKRRLSYNLDVQACWLDYLATIKKCAKVQQGR